MVHELRQQIRDSRVNNVYQLDPTTLLLKLHKIDTPPLQLVMEAGKRLHLTTYVPEKPSHPPDFCMALRKYLREEDILGRDCGNLGILLPETGQAESQTLLQRLSNLVQAHPVFQSDKTFSSTIQSLSFESFTYPDTGFVPESLRPVLEDLNNEYPTP